MARAGLRLNYRRVGEELNSRRAEETVKRHADEIAAQVAEDGHHVVGVDEYHTDRAVAGVVVRASDQARHGAATRAANRVAGRHSG